MQHGHGFLPSSGRYVNLCSAPFKHLLGFNRNHRYQGHCRKYRVLCSRVHLESRKNGCRSGKYPHLNVIIVYPGQPLYYPLYLSCHFPYTLEISRDLCHAAEYCRDILAGIRLHAQSQSFLKMFLRLRKPVLLQFKLSQPCQCYNLSAGGGERGKMLFYEVNCDSGINVPEFTGRKERKNFSRFLCRQICSPGSHDLAYQV